ncbi:hypothetical protein RO3G_17432 [Rhizopus delemar RA 99-880]|uniref:Uncharacterized protein n=1 Tax=Rhizopus delemar (strain RA 99-880 / ATCC MYA-4621 / FGSC 9543 / NRRL 43880) TaxID=246409 RepID=I1CW90_RHIO9|nr:hypothetical protein RO3G_17432 [Rhizopus delemar RA 99-880]|eukprot:EIE92720.1 hypothetical protein RO3G_17432 [Rhizopus delemar RA 99-880]
MYQQSPVSATNLVTSLNQKINYGLNDLWQRQEAVRSTISYPMSHDSKLFRKIDNISVNKFARLFVDDLFLESLFPSTVERPMFSFFIFEGKMRKSKAFLDYFV